MNDFLAILKEKLQAETPERTRAFVSYVYDKLLQDFDNSLMDAHIVKQNEINQLVINIPNASVKKEYRQLINNELIYLILFYDMSIHKRIVKVL